MVISPLSHDSKIRVPTTSWVNHPGIFGLHSSAQECESGLVAQLEVVCIASVNSMINTVAKNSGKCRNTQKHEYILMSSAIHT